MNKPKILPWIARKSGLSETRVAQLWRAAVSAANRSRLPHGSPAYWKRAMDIFLAAVEANKMSCALANQPALGESASNAILRCQLRMSVFGLITAQSLARVWSGAWQGSFRKAA